MAKVTTTSTRVEDAMPDGTKVVVNRAGTLFTLSIHHPDKSQQVITDVTEAEFSMLEGVFTEAAK